MTRSTRGRARWMVASRLPPSTTIISVPSALRSESASSAAVMASPSFSTGMMIESFDMEQWSRPRAASTTRAGSKRARRRFLERAAAARSLAGGAAVAMAADPDRPSLHLGFEQIGQVQALARVVFERQIEHLIEIAVVDVAPPIDRNQVSAHHLVEVGVEVRALQQVEVAVELAVGNEDRAEALNRHVGERVESVENDAVIFAEHALVVVLERLLRRRQRRTLGIIDEVEHEPSLGAPVAQPIEGFQPADGRFEHALAALAIDVVFEIAGKRSDDLDPLAGEKFGEVLLAGDFENGEIAAIHHAHAHGPRGGNQSTKMRVEFRRAAGDVEGRQALSRKESEHRVDYLARHSLGTVRAGVDVAVHAGLIAAIADIDLKRVEPAAPDRRKGNLLKPRPGIAHRVRPLFATQIRMACGARHVEWRG